MRTGFRQLIVLFVAIALLTAIYASSTTVKRRAVRVPANPVPAPHAVDDSYSMERGTSLTVAATSGVLVNDVSPTGAPLTATVTTAPTHGVLTLAADGGFTYVNDGSSATVDTFTYTASNGTTTSDPATVTITIQAPQPPISINVATPGGNFFFTFSGVAGQNPVLTLQRGRTYKFQVSTSSIHPFELLETPPGTVTGNNTSNGTVTFNVPAGPGTYRYHCSVHDFGNVINTTD